MYWISASIGPISGSFWTPKYIVIILVFSLFPSFASCSLYVLIGIFLRIFQLWPRSTRYMAVINPNFLDSETDSMSCLQAIEGEDTQNPFICHIMNLLSLLSKKGTQVCVCWIPSQCGMEENERVDQLAKETLYHNIDPLANVHADLKPLVNSYIQQLVRTKWDVAVHGRDLYLLKPTLGPPKKFQYLTRAEEVVITRLRIGHQGPYILSRGPPDYVSPLGSDTDYWPYAPGVCSVMGKSWPIIHSWLIEYSVGNNSWDLHCRISARSGILLPDMNGETFHTIPKLKHFF